LLRGINLRGRLRFVAWISVQYLFPEEVFNTCVPGEMKNACVPREVGNTCDGKAPIIGPTTRIMARRIPKE